MAPHQDSFDPSLPRLLSLENDHITFDEQLLQAACIVGLDESWTILGENLRIDYPSKPRYHHRDEYVLGWLLRKLSLEQNTGIEARSSWKAWLLLQNLLRRVAVFRCAQMLRQNDFLSILEQTLEENFEKGRIPSDSQESASSTSLPRLPSLPKKRKLDGSIVRHTTKERGFVPDFLMMLFSTICGVLNLAVTLSQESKHGALHMKHLLKTDILQAARLLRLWFTSTYKIAKSKTKGEFPISWRGDSNGPIQLSPILAVWELSTQLPENTNGLAIVFSQECLLPSTKLLSALYHPLESHGSIKVDRDHSGFPAIQPVWLREKGITRALEQLIARFILKPAQSPVFNDTRSSQDSSISVNPRKDVLYELLKPLSVEILYLTDQLDGLNGKDEDLEELLRGISSIFHIACRIIAKLGFKRRINEAPWIQDMFISLANCIGVAIPQGDRPTVTSNASLSAVERMLGLAREYKIKLDQDISKALVESYSNLSSRDSYAPVRWSLIAEVLTFDPDVFLPEINSRSDASRRCSSVDLSKLIILKISATKYSDSCANGTKAETYSNDNHMFQPRLSSEYVFLRDSVLLPLLEAYANGRILMEFISRWATELKLSAPIRDRAPFCQESIWEDRALSLKLKNVLESSVTIQQLSSFLTVQETRWASWLEAVKKHRPASSGDAIDHGLKQDVSSSIFLCDTILGVIHLESTIDSLKEKFESMLMILLSIGRRDSLAHLSASSEARMWAILAHLWAFLASSHRSDRLGPLAASLEASSCVKRAQCTTFRLIQDFSQQSYIAGYEAFKFIAKVYHNKMTDPNFVALVHTLRAVGVLWMRESRLSGFLCERGIQLRIPESRVDKLQNPLSDTNTIIEAYYLDLLAIVIQFPNLLQRMDPDPRKALFSGVFWGAWASMEAQYTTSLGLDALTYDVALKEISDWVFESSNSGIRSDLLSVFCMGLGMTGFQESQYADLSRMDERIAGSASRFSESLLLEVPVHEIPRENRESILDHISQEVCAENERDFGHDFRRLSLMTQLMELPNSTALISTKPTSLLKLTDKFLTNLEICQTYNMEKLVEELIRRTLMHIIATHTQERSKAYLQGISKHSQNILKTATSVSEKGNGGPVGLSTLTWIRSVISVLYHHNLLPLFDAKDKIRTLYWKLLRNDLSMVDVSQAHCQLRSLLLAFAKFPCSPEDSDPWFSKIKPFAQSWIQNHWKSLSKFENSDQDWAVPLHKVIATYGTSDFKDYLKLSISLCHNDLTARNFHGITDNFKIAASRFSNEDRALCASFLVDNAMDAYALLLLGVLLSTGGDGIPPALLGKLCLSLPKAESTIAFHSLIDCVELMIQLKKPPTSQVEVEMLVEAMVSVTSATAPKLAPLDASAVYGRLCGVTHQLLSLQRTRLRGRFHLLTPLLRQLLTCLFIPHSHHPNNFIASSLPPWLIPWEKPLTAANATSFARVLTTLCSPAVSSVSKHRGFKLDGPQLVDETKKARQYTGEYVYGMIEWFCKCQLHGRLSTEVRQGLMPGLWNCLDVMTIEGMRAMNSGLDASSMALWKSLYSDWKRLGGRGER